MGRIVLSMSRLRWAVILLAVGALGLGGALVGCGGGKGGLYGTVTRGPTSPVCRAGVPCSEPASGARLVFERDGRVAAQVVVAKDGSYSVSLAPGTYVVGVAPQPTIGRGVDARTVRVTAARARRLDFQIDTGIR